MDDKKARVSGLHSKKMNRNIGHLFIISAPSGAGKTTLSRAALDHFDDMLYSISYTTRKSRGREKDGVDYYFISENDFNKRIESGKWAEWAEVHGNFYGTSAKFLDKGLASGHDILLDIDIQGTIQMLKRYPDSITIFIMPPSLETLRNRLVLRGTDSEEVVERRLQNAQKEMERKDLYRHIIVNDRLSAAIEELISIVENYRTAQKKRDQTI